MEHIIDESIPKIKSGQSGNSDKNKYIRKKRFEMRLSPDEYSELENKYKQSGFNSMTAYARMVLFNTSNITKIEQKKIDCEINLFMQAAGRIGNNINQIARVLNHQPDTPIKSQALDELGHIRTQLVSLQKAMIKMRGYNKKKK